MRLTKLLWLCTLCVCTASAFAQPLNDDCANAEIVSTFGVYPWDNTGSVIDGPTTGLCATLNSDIWFSFTSPVDGLVRFETLPTPGGLTDTVMVIYDGASGCPISATGYLGCNDDAGIGLLSLIDLTLVSGNEYLIQIGDWSTSVAQGPGTLWIAESQPEICDDGLDNDFDGLVDCGDTLDCPTGVAPCIAPANDEPIGAVLLSSGISEPFTLVLATTSVGLTCRGNSDVWYEYTAAIDGTHQVLLSGVVGVIGGSTDTNHSVYLNPGGGLYPTDADQIACIDPYNGSALMTTGNSYLIRVGMWSSTSTNQCAGDITVTEPSPEICDDGIDNDFDGSTDCFDSDCSGVGTCPVAPVNDDCATPTPMLEDTVVSWDLTGATTQPGLSCRGNSDVWFSFTAGADVTATIQLAGVFAAVGTSTDTNHSLYFDPGPGVCPTDADLVSCIDPYSGTAALTSGTDYLVRVGMWSSTSTNQAAGDLMVITGTQPEDCGDGFDNDLDGLVDCFDTVDCTGAPACAPPANDEPAGAITLTAGLPEPWTTLWATTTTGLTCRGTYDVWYEYTSALDAVHAINLTNVFAASGFSTDTNHSVYLNPGAGLTPTDADQIACIDPFGGAATLTTGQSYLIRVGMWSTTTTNMAAGDLTVIEPGPEICDDGFDNDFDGWEDCEDSDCSGIGICPIGPANDMCVDAITLTGGVAEPFDTVNATNEGLLTCRGTADVWYEFTAATDTAAQLALTNVTGGSTDTNHSMYLNPGLGACPTDADQVACIDPYSGNVSMSAGQSYLIRVGMWSTTTTLRASGDVTVVLPTAEDCANGIDDDFDGAVDCGDADCIGIGTCPAITPVNDMCADAITLTDALPEPFTTVDATNEVPLTCRGQADVWYEYTAAADGDLSVQLSNVTGGSTDTNHSVYMNPGAGACPTDADQLACIDPYGGIVPGVLSGESYLIRVGMWSTTSTLRASGDVTATLLVPITNDDCIDALPVIEGTYSASNIGATTDGPATDVCGTTDLNSDVWFAYTASFTGQAVIETTPGTLTDTVLAVYDGTATCPVTLADQLACDDDSGVGLASLVTVSVTAGDLYLIQVGDWSTSIFTGTFGLNIVEAENCTDGIDNDGDGDTDCADSDCVAFPACIEQGNCADGIDNDADGLTDCDDADCATDPVCLPVYAGETDLIINHDAIDGNEGLLLDGLAVKTALENNGRTPLLVNLSVTDSAFLLAEPFEAVWVLVGTYPADDPLLASELNALYVAQQAGKAIYRSGSDEWGFTPVASDMDDVDGVDGAADGTDSPDSCDGFDSLLTDGDFSAFADMAMTDDATSSEFIDELVVATPASDPGIVAAGKFIGPDDALSPGATWAMVIGVETVAGGKVISSSPEFAAFDPAQQDALMLGYMTFLGLGGTTGPEFKRGDANNDGATNIADAVFVAQALFVPGSPPIVCDDAADTNDDGAVNIADAVYVAQALFVPGAPPIPEPVLCGVDPTDEVVPLGCDTYDHCP